MKNDDWVKHVTGTSKFINDVPLLSGTLHAFVFTSPIAKGKIIDLNYFKALELSGIKNVLTYKDIPGVNQLGTIIKDEPLLAENEVHFIGQPLAIIIGEDEHCVRNAIKFIECKIEEEAPILDPREAFRKNELIAPPVTFALGNVDAAWKECDVIVEGAVNSGGQEHVYLETQSAYSVPLEGGIKIYSSTQSPTAVQRVTAGILNLPMHKIEVDVLRLGGGFGGKEDQATVWAAIAGLASYVMQTPVKISLSRHEDIMLTGKRHPYSSDYKIGLNSEGEILAYEVYFYQNAGASADLSTAILERTMFHCTNSYFIPNVKATAYSCRTNLPPNTAFRGFGGPQGMFVIESAIHKAASKLNVEPCIIQEKNLLNEGDEFPYGQKAVNCVSHKAWFKAKELFPFEKLSEEISLFNIKNKLLKKGMAVMPICFGISFTNAMLNQASALVHIYTDGSVGISTGAVEMGQGVNMKLRQVAASIFSININKIKIETTNTTRAANTSPTAASTGADLNGNAVEKACNTLAERLKHFAVNLLKAKDIDQLKLKDEQILNTQTGTSILWDDLILQAYFKRIDLSEHAHYATPKIYFDRTINKGNPFAYHVYGTAVIQVEVDCLRGVYKINSVKAVHDFGKSINPAIDKSQAEGAIMQGLGWMTLEEIRHDSRGKILSDTLSAYKVPDVHFTPEVLEIEFLENPNKSAAIFNSKAIGEPPLMYGIGAYFAIANAIKSFRQEVDILYDAPFTPEKVLMSILGSPNC
ncbi:MAG: xanthine dehydrogenase [Ignavibacteria bacterium CG2_30_36_16]|nr:molybdopterin-dependent oxidoreductase [Ignavibacteria bacterium]OIP58934.1 MAG: xanthine dehydrogenase [Ignavibacteria bacterium CG2_30_36_16]PJB01066.1 MAG: xanthine dehydrogenase [Ignavibacteria bacterium CG_4_9_14_3_um_filter_36_18]